MAEPFVNVESIVAMKEYLMEARLSGQGNSKHGIFCSEKWKLKGIKVKPMGKIKLSSSTILNTFKDFIFKLYNTTLFLSENVFVLSPSFNFHSYVKNISIVISLIIALELVFISIFPFINSPT